MNVQGLQQDVLIPNLKLQNRAWNADIVAIEILPKSQWVKNYKSLEPINALLDEDNAGVGLEEAPTSTTLMEQINNSKHYKPTARVVGVIKKLAKTYGGSILAHDQMLDSTKLKLKEYQQRSPKPITDQELQKHYRVFVPYNTQLPQVLVRSNRPEALENKRLIVRLTKWPIYSPFPRGQFVKIIG